METQAPGWTLGELAEALGGELHGPAELRILRPAPADSDDSQAIAFAESDEYLRIAEASSVAAVIISNGRHCSKPHIIHDRPRIAFARLLHMSVRPLPLAPGVHPTAVVSDYADVAPSANIGPFAVIEAGAVIGERCQVFPFCYVGESCKVGEGTVLYPHVVLYQNVHLGRNCIVHSGTILGADGFGFDWNGSEQVKVPQVGSVHVGDSVEIGSNAAIDRATAGATTIGSGSKIDNLVQVGHNVKIGEHTVIAGLTGLSGSSELGDRVTVGGQAATSHHVRVCDDVTLGGRTGVTQSITEPGAYLGLPARPMGEAMRAMALGAKLPELMKRIRELERKVEELEKGTQ